MFEAASAQARAITILWWFFFALLAAIFVIVIGIAAASLRNGSRLPEPSHRPAPAVESKLQKTVGIAIGATVLILFALLIVSVATGRNIANPAHDLTIEITGNQWWWYVRYANNDPSRIVVTANEVHIPIGTPVELRLMSNDVIHSFWVPGLNGKRDLIPSRVNAQWIRAERPGRYRGQCAEFCGLQHAHMGLVVVADEPQDFENWYNWQLQSSFSPSDDETRRGQQIFLSKACVLCHSIQGTPANGQVAPDLTHLASRSTIAAGTRPNTKGDLAGWITDPQSVKPGNHMATVPIGADEIQPLVDYLESLK